MTLDALFQPSPDFSTLYVFGAGGSGREVAWLAQQCWGGRVHVVHRVDRAEFVSAPVNGHPVQLVRDVVAASDARFIVAIGDSSVRRTAVETVSSVAANPWSRVATLESSARSGIGPARRAATMALTRHPAERSTAGIQRDRLDMRLRPPAQTRLDQVRHGGHRAKHRKGHHEHRQSLPFVREPVGVVGVAEGPFLAGVGARGERGHGGEVPFGGRVGGCAQVELRVGE